MDDVQRRTSVDVHMAHIIEPKIHLFVTSYTKRRKMNWIKI
jgi:hypothetical protein